VVVTRSGGVSKEEGSGKRGEERLKGEGEKK